MPYIKHNLRADLVPLAPSGALNAGELNFQITMLATLYLKNHGLKYQTMNDIIGALEACKLEFVRRVVNPYENTKIETNGDCY